MTTDWKAEVAKLGLKFNETGPLTLSEKQEAKVLALVERAFAEGKAEGRGEMATEVLMHGIRAAYSEGDLAKKGTE